MYPCKCGRNRWRFYFFGSLVKAKCVFCHTVVSFERDKKTESPFSEFLHSHGWADYKEYLKSDLWKANKKKFLDTVKSKYGSLFCFKCRSKFRLEVHHKTYERIGHELFEDLAVLCHRCHRKLKKR